MLHRNTSSAPLSFDLGGRHYDVAAGGEVDIPLRYAYAVKPRGLPLVPSGPAPAAGEEGPPAVVEEGVEVWHARAFEQRDRGDLLATERDAATLRAVDAEQALAAEREAREGFVAELRATLSIEPGASILDAIRALQVGPKPAPAAKRGAAPAAPKADAPAPAAAAVEG